VCTPFDATALRKKIRYAIENQDLRTKLATVGRNVAKTYSWKHVANQYEKCIEGIQ
jgi:hypothetical protein